MKATPFISIITPTLNCATSLKDLLSSIKMQNYPQHRIEIVVVDGGSVDQTLQVARDYKCTILSNPLFTGEAGKSIGIRHAIGDYIALLDSDNILPTNNWLSTMLSCLQKEPDVVCAEPIEFTYRKSDGFITRYCALLGVNDPIVYYLGNYDRYSKLSNTWTKIEHTSEDRKDYLKVTFNAAAGLPTIGANGTIYKSSFIKNTNTSEYLFDIDVLASKLKHEGTLTILKVKTSIVHIYCGDSIVKFIRKQSRRIADNLYYTKQGLRSYNWNINKVGYIKFIVFCFLVFPFIIDSIRGFIKKRDYAWFVHTLLCEITFMVYGFTVILFKIGILSGPKSRSKWKQ
ncbi:MAG: glycosyltransferase family 2 protein [Patescibacteria group bacterium]